MQRHLLLDGAPGLACREWQRLGYCHALPAPPLAPHRGTRLGRRRGLRTWLPPPTTSSSPRARFKSSTWDPG